MLLIKNCRAKLPHLPACLPLLLLPLLLRCALCGLRRKARYLFRTPFDWSRQFIFVVSINLCCSCNSSNSCCCSYSNYCPYSTYCCCSFYFSGSSCCSYFSACIGCLCLCILAFSSCQNLLRIWLAAPRLGANTYHARTHKLTHTDTGILPSTHSPFTLSHTHIHRHNTPYVHRLAKAASASPTPFATANAFCCCCCCWRGSITSLCIVTMVTFLIKFYFMPPFWRLPHAPTPHLLLPRVCGENLWRCM